MRLDLLKRLCETPGIPGYEDRIRAIVIPELHQVCDEISTDALGIAVLVGLALAGFHVFVALRTRNTETAFLIANFLTLPLLFTSSAQLPLPLLPEWLQVVARFNPITYAIEAMRLAFNGPQAVPDQDAGRLVLTALAALTLPLAVRSFRRAVR